MPADTAELEAIVRHLAAIERPSASDGEREAAEWIAERLRELGHEAAVEEERAHGGYWWPLGLFSALGALAGAAGRRGLGALVGAVAALGIWDELGLWRGWTRWALPKRSTWNVVGRAGEPEAERVVVVVAHHDAAHGGLIFDPSLLHAWARRFPEQLEKARSWPRVNWLVFAGPVLVGAGSLLGARRLRRLGTLLSAGSAAAFADIGRRPVVPGANDNLSGVAALFGVARGLAERPVAGIRVLLVSTGSEESFEEGMLGFVRRHAAELEPERTSLLVLDTVGSPRLVLVEGEGMLVRRAYDAALKDVVADAAREADVPIVREHWLSFGSDALVGLRKGLPAMLLASFDEFKLPSNYHSPTDTADNVDYGTVAQAATVIEGAVRRLADQARAARA
jgi:hypothetical protein